MDNIWFWVAIVLSVAIIKVYRDLRRENLRNKREMSEESQRVYEQKKKELLELEEKLQEATYLNPVTKVYNMDYFKQFARRRLDEICESENFLENEKKAWILVGSVANILEINKLFGMTETDRVIYGIAQLVKEKKKDSIYGHIQSNLLCVLYENNTESEVIRDIQSFTEEIRKHSSEITVELEFGIYEIKDMKRPINEMINAATLAKKSIENRKICNYNIYTWELEEQFAKNKQMVKEMQTALEEHKFVVHLQPMVDLRRFRVVAAEALVRWDYKEQGLLSPYAFIPLFESNLLVQNLDYYVWEECCKLIRRWIDNEIDVVPITVNVSPVHLQDTRFIQVLDRLCQKYKVEKQHIILEITEQSIVSQEEEGGGDSLRELTKRGYFFCIDNFGKKYTSIGLLKEVPTVAVKIDRKFIQNNTGTQEERSVLKYLVALAKELELQVVAEGIETIEQANFLADIGVDSAQGFFFSRPVDIRTFDHISKSMVKKVYPTNEFYPTFQDFENQLNALEKMVNE